MHLIKLKEHFVIILLLRTVRVVGLRLISVILQTFCVTTLILLRFLATALSNFITIFVYERDLQWGLVDPFKLLLECPCVLMVIFAVDHKVFGGLLRTEVGDSVILAGFRGQDLHVVSQLSVNNVVHQGLKASLSLVRIAANSAQVVDENLGLTLDEQIPQVLDERVPKELSTFTDIVLFEYIITDRTNFIKV